MSWSEETIKKLRKRALGRRMSPMEKVIMNLLRDYKIAYTREYMNVTLLNPKTKYPLYIDFYIPKYDLAIEYDGKQHFQDKNAKRLKEQKFRDSIKDIWCQVNNIDLLRISYLEQDKIIKIITKKLNEKGFTNNRSSKRGKGI